MIKNAISYVVEMPSAEEMREFASGFMSREPGEQERSTFGFAVHPVTQEVVSDFETGYCVSMLLWEKKIDLVHVFSDDYHKNQREILEHLKNLISYKTSGDVKFLSRYMFKTKVPLDLGLLEFYRQLNKKYVISEPSEHNDCFNSGFIEIK